MINYSKEMGKLVTVVLALIMMAPVGLTFTDNDIILADFPPTVTIYTPSSEEHIYNGTILIDWLATDVEDADPTLDIEIEGSPDAGASWFTIMSGTNNNNPPYAWDTVASGAADGVNYIFKITATDSVGQSDSNTSYMFSIDNIPDDRWYLQIESTNLGSHLDLDMRPSESTIQKVSIDVTAPGEFFIQSFASEYVASRPMDLMGDWNFSLFAKVSSSDADGRLYANVYADDGITQRLLFITDYDDQTIGSYFVFHEFAWSYFVPPRTLLEPGEHIVVEIMLNATAGSVSSTNYHYAESDIPVLGNVIGNYTMTHVSDDQREVIEEVQGSNGTIVTIIDEKFTHGIPSQWTIVDDGSNGGPGPNDPTTWHTENYGNRSGGLPMLEPFAVADSLRHQGSMDEQLITPTLDLTTATSVTLEFDQYLLLIQEQRPGEWGNIDIRSTLTGGSWLNLLHQDSSTTNPDYKFINVTAWAAGAPDVEIRFHYYADHLCYWWILDNIKVKAQASENITLLEHKWTIDVPTTVPSYTFSLEAKKGNQPRDEFLFTYSNDDVNYYDLVTIDRNQEEIHTCTLPTNPFGTTYIRVVDTDRYTNEPISRIEIDHMFISSGGGPPTLTLGFDNYKTPSFIEPTLTLSPTIYLCIQDAPGGIGNNVTTHTMTTDETYTVWSVGYDADRNYVSEIPTNWTNTLNAQTATNSTSFTLNPTAPGSGTITAVFNATLSDTTGLITVTVGLLDNIIIRDFPGGLGNEVDAYSMTTDDTLTVWAAGYDADGNYIGDIFCNWSTNETLDFQSAVGVNTFIFDPSTPSTSGYITALNGTVFDSAGLITVGVGVVNYILIRYAPGGGGSEVDDVLMVLGQTLTVYSAGYDVDNNYIGDVPCNWTTTGTLNLTTATNSSSFTFEPAAGGESGTINASFDSTISDETGTITVTGFGIDYIVIEDALGNEVTTHLMDTTEILTVWAIAYNSSVGAISPVSTNWTTTGTLDLQTSTMSQSFTFAPVHAPTNGTIEALYGTLWDATGLITVITGPLAYLCVQDASGGIGTNITTHTMTTEETLTVWAIGYDAEWNYISDVNCDWTTTGTLDLQTATGVDTFTFSPVTPGSGTIEADNLAGHTDSTGLITVNNGTVSNILIRDSPGGMGNVAGAYSMTTDESLTVWAAGYDFEWNYIIDIDCNWSTNGTLDFQTAIMVNTFTFDPSTAGTSGYIIAVNGTLSGSTGLITVGIGALNYIIIKDTSGGGGSEVGDVLMGVGQTLTVYSAGYDADNNYIGDIICNWTTTGTLNLTTATSTSSFTFEPAAVGEIGTIVASFNLPISDETGIITVIDDLLPVADAGPDQTVIVNSFVNFDGTGSTDDIGITNYWWNFTDGGPVTLNGVFPPPYLFTTVGVYTVTLTVRDTGGQEDQDIMMVNVTTDSTPPVADAGPDQTVAQHTLVTFDGSGSTDDFGINSYWWNFTDGGSQSLTGVGPSYTFDNEGIYTVTLTVMDTVGQTDSDIMFVNVTDGDPPVAEAGPNWQVIPGDIVTFDGTASYDPGHLGEPIVDGISNWTWTFDDGTGPQIIWGSNQTHQFTLPGIYMVTLTVSDNAPPVTGGPYTDTDFMIVRVTEIFDIDITEAAGSNGWILISFPNKVVGNPLSLIVDAKDDGAGLVTWDIVQWYDHVTGEWLTTATFKPPPLNTFNYVDNTYSFWIHITGFGDGNLTIAAPLATTGELANIQLQAGWNLVGYPFPTAQPMIDTFGILINLDMPVETYDPADPYRLRIADILTEDHEPGHGYWVHVAADEILAIQCL